MRDLINIVESTKDAASIYDGLSVLARYRLIDSLPYTTNKALRRQQCCDYIADHLGEFTHQSK